MQEIEDYLESRMGTYSFFFEDLRSGYVFGYNENVKMVAAGCMKLPIAIALIKEEEEERVSFLDKVRIEKKDKVCGNGIIHEFEDRDYTIFELLVAMLIQSDNTAANKIIDLIGMGKINETISILGLENTTLNRKTNDERNKVIEVENITTANDLCKIWKILNDGSYLNKDNSTMLIDILARQQKKNKLALYIQDDLKIDISSKSGDKNGVENDTEYIKITKGEFAFTVMSTGIPNSVYGTITLAKVGKMMWDNIMNKWN
ncbi:serine hydrolase [uncultured Clostridium sp.]|jgi:beta-lactamase class A|uniref:serine hydrolase n=1 Tax=uncultured Clostridium sp. TaxID=59620 RepID=UPI00260E6E8C|nr:serine hydrolase [uncultured Clostridium sp.]